MPGRRWPSFRGFVLPRQRGLLVSALLVVLLGALAVPAVGREWTDVDDATEGLPPEVGIGAAWQVADAGAIQANGDLLLLDHGPANIDPQDEGLTAQKADTLTTDLTTDEVDESEVLAKSGEATTPEEAVTDGTPAPALIPAPAMIPASAQIRDFVTELLFGPATGPDAAASATATPTPTPTPDKCRPAGATATPTQGGASPSPTPTATPTPGGTPCPTSIPVAAPGLGQPTAEGGVKVPVPVGPGGFPLPLPGSGGGGHTDPADTPPTAQPTAEAQASSPAAPSPAAPAPAAPTAAPLPGAGAPPSRGPAPSNPVEQAVNDLVNEIWEAGEEYRKELDEAIESGKDTLRKGGEWLQDPSMERAGDAARSVVGTIDQSANPLHDPTWAPARHFIRKFFGFNLAGDASLVAASPPEDGALESDP